MREYQRDDRKIKRATHKTRFKTLLSKLKAARRAFGLLFIAARENTKER
jgi:hypothetical protein